MQLRELQRNQGRIGRSNETLKRGLSTASIQRLIPQQPPTIPPRGTLIISSGGYSRELSHLLGSRALDHAYCDGRGFPPDPHIARFRKAFQLNECVDIKTVWAERLDTPGWTHSAEDYTSGIWQWPYVSKDNHVQITEYNNVVSFG
jgi:hypothetical protein